jgi:hypothetical protein
VVNSFERAKPGTRDMDMLSEFQDSIQIEREERDLFAEDVHCGSV